MNKILALVLVLSLFCVYVESKPGFFDSLSNIGCKVARNCQQPAAPTSQRPQTQPVRSNTVEEGEVDNSKRIIGTDTCAAGFRMDRQGNCRKIA